MSTYQLVPYNAAPGGEDRINWSWLHPEKPLETGRYEFVLPDGRGTMRVDVYPAVVGDSWVVSVDRRPVLVSFSQDMHGVPAGKRLAAMPAAHGQRLTTPTLPGPGSSGTAVMIGDARVGTFTPERVFVFEDGIQLGEFVLDKASRTGW
jgi:hypothetical protein